MLKKLKNIVNGWVDVANTKSTIAANKATLDSDKIIKMALDVADDINKIRKAKLSTSKAIQDAKDKSEQHKIRYEQVETSIKKAVEQGIEVADTQYVIALQSKQLSEAYLAKAKEMEAGIEEYDVATEKLKAILQDLKMQKDMIKLNEESVNMGIEVKGIDQYYKNRIIDVDTLLDKIGIMSDNTISNTSSLDLELYKQSFK